MNGKKMTIVSVAALAGLGVVALLSSWFGKSSPRRDEGETLVVRTERSAPKKAVVAKAGGERPRSAWIDERKEKPSMTLEGDEFDGLSEEMKELMVSLQDALDREDRHTVSKLAEKILEIQREKGESAVPVTVREHVVDAIGWFLPETLSDLVGFMADSDPDVLDEVMSQFEESLDSSVLGDRELSAIVKTMSKVIKDDDALDALFFCVESDMRNSIVVDTYLDMLANATDECKARIWSSVEDFTGEDGIDTPDKLKQWLKENPDDEDDEDFYSVEKDADDEAETQEADGKAKLK